MKPYLLKRLGFIPIGVLGVFTLTFLLLNLVDSDPVTEIAGPSADQARLDDVTRQLGLDQSMWERYFDSLRGLFTLDLGNSWFTNADVMDTILGKLPATIELVFLSLVVSLIVGIALGTLSAYQLDRRADGVSKGVVTLLQVIPDFLLGLVLIYFLFYSWGVLPAPTGQLGLLDTAPPKVTGAVMVDAIIAGEWSTLGSAVQHAILPVLALGVGHAALFAKMTRSIMAKSLQSHQVEFARACGLSPWKTYTYAMGAARTQLMTYAGILFAGLVGGDVIVEQLFAWDGIGSYIVARINQHDIPMVQGAVLVLAVVTLLTLFVVDTLTTLLDPRISK
jgi:peptide/nickel transport system permease protein